MSTRMHHQRGHVPCIRGVARVPAHQAPAGEPVRNPRVPRASAALACAHARAPLPAGNTQCLDTLAESRLNCAATKHSCALYDAPFQMRRPRPGSAPDQLGASAFGDLGASIADAGAGVEALYAQALSQAVQRGQRARRSVAGALRALQATRAQPLSRAPFAKIQPPGLGQPSGQLGAGAEASSDVGSAVPAHAPHRGPIHPAPRIAAKQLPESATFEPFSVEEIATRCADSTRSVVGHAQTSLDTAQRNWASLLAGTSRWADDVGIANRNGGQTPLESAFGDLWNDALPSFRGTKAWRALRKDDLRQPGRHVTIVTTASLPWMTGTAVNPLLRAHYLAEQGVQRAVTLVVPWLGKADQEIVYPASKTFDTPEQQEAYVRAWVEERTGKSSEHFKLAFYPGRYAPEKGSILPVGDLTKWIPEHEADVAVLEEPEHLNWYQHGSRWTDKFNHVVGIMHTNYLDYARREEHGGLKAAFLRGVNGWVCRVHCHKVIKLSDAVQRLPRQCTEFVHGVSPRFLEVGAQKAADAKEARREASDATGTSDAPEAATWRGGAYFLGKVVWAKGYTELLDLLEQHKAKHGRDLQMDVYGSGDDSRAVQARAKTSRLQLNFHPGRDHADEDLQAYKVFVNPSLSDVVATTTAEALAMGKFVLCAEHPCNHFFSTFSNCIIYRTPEEFSEKLQWALAHDPKPMSHSELARLSWEDATERFLDAVQLSPLERPNRVVRALDNVAAAAHNTLMGVEVFRSAAGAGANTLEAPQRVTDFESCHDDHGGLFDNHSRAASVRKRL